MNIANGVLSVRFSYLTKRFCHFVLKYIYLNSVVFSFVTMILNTTVDII